MRSPFCVELNDFSNYLRTFKLKIMSDKTIVDITVIICCTVVPLFTLFAILLLVQFSDVTKKITYNRSEKCPSCGVVKEIEISKKEDSNENNNH